MALGVLGPTSNLELTYCAKMEEQSAGHRPSQIVIAPSSASQQRNHHKDGRGLMLSLGKKEGLETANQRRAHFPASVCPLSSHPDTP